MLMLCDVPAAVSSTPRRLPHGIGRRGDSALALADESLSELIAENHRSVCQWTFH